MAEGRVLLSLGFHAHPWFETSNLELLEHGSNVSTASTFSDGLVSQGSVGRIQGVECHLQATWVPPCGVEVNLDPDPSVAPAAVGTTVAMLPELLAYHPKEVIHSHAFDFGVWWDLPARITEEAERVSAPDPHLLLT
jgi:hypothetical protein